MSCIKVFDDMCSYGDLLSEYNFLVLVKEIIQEPCTIPKGPTS